MTEVVLLLLILILIVFGYVKFAKLRSESQRDHFIDVQTGLLNRAGFVARFESEISDFSRNNYHLTYFMIDSNRMQAYHPDVEFVSAVRYLAEVLKKNQGNYEFAARITESGFAMALCEKDEISATKRIMKIIDDLSIMKDANKRSMSDVFKISLYKLEDHDNSCEMLLFNLRRNCNTLEGKENYVYCDKQSMNRVQNEKQKTEELKKALQRGEFKLYVQFIVDNKTKKIVSGEALSRWENPHKGIRLPGTYISAMMSSGLIVEFDYFMFEKVCQQLQKWKGTELEYLSLSCNFTRITISEEDFVKRISSIADKYSFDREKLTLEITEETLEKNRERALSNVRECKNLGFKIALDDFCSGFTSPINLCEYPIDVVKIDREVLLNIERKKGKELFKGLVSLGHSMDLKIVCEGVENKEQHKYVDSTSCDYIQGWYFSKAIPVRRSEDFIRNFAS